MVMKRFAGMITFDQSLYALYRSGQISLEQALVNADSRTDLKPRIKLAQPVEQAPRLDAEPATGTHGRK